MLVRETSTMTMDMIRAGWVAAAGMDFKRLMLEVDQSTMVLIANITAHPNISASMV
jgi:hypothetical protein